MKCKDCEYYREPSYELFKNGYDTNKDHIAVLDDSAQPGRFIHAHCLKYIKPVSYYDSCSHVSERTHVT